MSLVHFELEASRGRHVSIRFRVVYAAGRGRLVPGDFDRPFGLPVGDAIPFKREVDVFVEGAAHPAHTGDYETTVRVRAGSIDRSARVFGERRIVWHRGKLRIGAPLELEPTPLAAANAYGGAAGHVRYPRNPIGKGYLLDEAAAEGVVLPPIEDPDDLLDPERLVLPADEWWASPRPVLFEPALVTSFPRVAFLGIVRPPPHPTGDELPEVRTGDLPRGFALPRSPAPEHAQEAERRMRLAELSPGADVVVDGCLPGGRTWRARTPPVLTASLEVDGRSEVVEPRPQTVRLRPERDEIVVTYAIEKPLARAFIPGIHARIPIAIDVLGERLAATTPEPVLAAVRGAGGVMPERSAT